MESKEAFKKVHHTALVIIPEPIEQIQAIRSKYDTAYERWPPHINVQFPFVDPIHFDEVYNVLQNEVLADVPAFDIRFEHLANLKKSVLVAEPETFDRNIHRVFHKIMSRYPFLNDLNKLGNEGYTPHLTLGRFGSGEIEKRTAEFQASWKPFTYRCNKLYMIQRDRDTPFVIKKVINLKE